MERTFGILFLNIDHLQLFRYFFFCLRIGNLNRIVCKKLFILLKYQNGAIHSTRLCEFEIDWHQVHNCYINQYQSFRSPFPMFFHSTWFTPLHHKEGFLSFLDEILKKDDVFLVTTWQMLQWIRDPTPRNNLYKFKPFQCNYPVKFHSYFTLRYIGPRIQSLNYHDFRISGKA